LGKVAGFALVVLHCLSASAISTGKSQADESEGSDKPKELRIFPHRNTSRSTTRHLSTG
jgi:hypothetical protein